jgi:hypothetical protein
MKSILIAIASLAISACAASAQSVYVDATENSLGPYGGTYKHIRVKKGTNYKITIEKNNAVFNTSDGAKMVNLGVMYVQPPRKMKIQIIEPGKSTYVDTEGNLYLFFVDDARLNSGGAIVNIQLARR